MKKLLLLLTFFSAFWLNGQNEFFAPVNGELTISECTGTLYDDGGATGNYVDENQSLIFFEVAEGSYLEFTFTEFDVETNFDNLAIFEGVGLDGTTGELVGSYDGTNLPNGGNSIAATGPVVAIFFSSDFTINGTGFAIDFACQDFTDPPTANANFPALSCSGVVTLSDNSTGFPTSWAWGFGDGNTSVEQNPTHTYADAGSYQISLTACNDNGCDTFTSTSSIVFDPESTACNEGTSMLYQDVVETTNCTGVLYDNGGADGNYLDNSYDQFSISPPNATNITLTFLDFNLGNAGEHTDMFYVYDPVTFQTLDVFFGTNLPNGGAPLTYNTSQIVIYFTSDHETNASGFSVLWEADGTDAAPVATFSIENTNAPLNSPVSFMDESTSGGGWTWNFGDGNTSNEQNPTHIYTTPGTYEVSLTVSNCNGSDTALSQTVTVQGAPDFTYSPGSFAVTLDAGTTGTEMLNLCNVGLGDLVLNANNQGFNSNIGYQLGFATSENGADFSWQLADINGNLIQESQQVYAPNQTYVENIFGLELGQEYLLTLLSPDGVQALDSFTWYDPLTGDILFEGQLLTGPEAIYVMPPPSEGEFFDWLDLSEGSSVLSPDVCEDLTLTFDATDLNGGVYEGEITITTNDPNNPTVTIPVTLTVIGIPEISVSAQDLDFGEIQVGGSSTIALTIANEGTDVLTVSGLTSTEAVFVLDTESDLTLQPGETREIAVTFTPTAITDYSTQMSLENNAGSPILVNLTGTGIAAPSLTIDPTEFTIELISGQDTTLNVNLGNVGEANLVYSALASTDATGFIFTFTTDFWGSEFSWNVTNSAGQIVANSTQVYASTTEYTELITGLSDADTYTLNLFDSFGDGALSQFSVTSASTGGLIAEGAFVAPANPDTMSVPLGSIGENILTITPENGTLGIDGNQVLDLFVDTDGMATGVYNLVVTLETNDPLQPTVDVNITLYVIAPVAVDFVASPEFVCGNFPVQFNDLTTNVATSWQWDLGDGTTSTEQNPMHTYAEDGNYTVRLIACNSLGCDTLVLTDYVTVETDCYTQNIPTEHNQEIITVCSGNVYDSGGPTADYLEGNNGVLQIAPPGAESITITFSEFNYEEHADYLYVYDGDNFTGTLLGAYTGTELAEQTLVAESGVLTLQEYAGHFIQLSGFAASFSCDADPVLPTANFSYLGDTICVNEPFLFFDESIGNVDTYFWDFGEGTTSNVQNPIINFTESDTVNVSLTVCNEVGCDTYIENNVVIILDKTCVQNTIPSVGENIFISSCSGSLYDSGGPDENYIQGSLGSVTLVRETGTVAVVFSEFDYGAEDYILILDGEDSTAPIIGFYSGNTLPEDGGIISSTGTALTIVEYTGFETTGSGFVLQYTCTSSADDEDGLLRVFNDDMCDGMRRFATPETANVDSWSWDFGDGMTSSEASPMHEFAEAGSYEVALTTCYQGDCQTETTSIFTNKLTPEIDAPNVAAIGEEVHFHGLTEAATHWTWDMGNGENFDHDAPVTTYTEEGYHDIHVHLTNMNVHETCTAQHTHTLLVTADGTSSTEDVNARNIRVFPNPATSFLTIDLGDNLATDVEIILTAIDGRIVARETYRNSLDVSSLTSGTYILQVLVADELPQQFKVTIAQQP